MDNIKLIANKLFYDSVGKRNIPQGVMFFASTERALKMVDGGFANVISRPKPIQEIKTDVIPPVAKPVVKKAEPKKVVKKVKVKK